MQQSDMIFVVGRQRSGTTVFRDLLERAGAMNCDEIFHGDLSRPHRFFRYVYERIQADPQLVHPENYPRLFKDYIDELRKVANGRKLVMDVKYFGLNLIPAREDVDARSPFIVHFMRSNKAHVVHIIRRNKLRVHVSEELSRATGKWSARKREDVPSDKPKLTFDVARTLESIKRLEKQDERVGKMLATIPNVERLYYDEMFDENGMFSLDTKRVARRFMELDEVDPNPGNIRMNPEGLQDLVHNYEELATFLEGSGYEWMLTGHG